MCVSRNDRLPSSAAAPQFASPPCSLLSAHTHQQNPAAKTAQTVSSAVQPAHWALGCMLIVHARAGGCTSVHNGSADAICMQRVSESCVVHTGQGQHCRAGSARQVPLGVDLCSIKSHADHGVGWHAGLFCCTSMQSCCTCKLQWSQLFCLTFGKGNSAAAVHQQAHGLHTLLVECRLTRGHADCSSLTTCLKL
jgi:hypothetical protein